MIFEHLQGRQRILLLQGPMGHFFRVLAQELREAGKCVRKINFNAGDAWYYPEGDRYTGRLADWPAFLDRYCSHHGIEVLVVFGDCRAYHRMARDVARDLGIQFLVFEEGYLRPNWLTLEPWGVNGHTQLPRCPTRFVDLSDEVDIELLAPLRNRFAYRAALSFWYYFVTWLCAIRFWHYQHHRLIGWSEALRWIRGGCRKLWYRWKERHVTSTLLARHDGAFTVFALQVHNDSQLVVHAGRDMRDYIADVIESFACWAPPDQVLVIKHHPMDRAYRDYTCLIHEVARRQQVLERVFYVHDLHLPTLLDHARAVVTVNSTVGFTALLRGLPVKTLGKAFYDIPGLTAQDSLDRFWADASAPDIELAKRFKRYLKRHCQLHGCVYARNPLVDPRLTAVWAQQHVTQQVPEVEPVQQTLFEANRFEGTRSG